MARVVGLAAGACLLMIGASSAPPPSVTPVPRADWARDRQEAVLQEVRAAKERVPLIVIGDSITQGWATEGAEVWRTRLAPAGAMNLGVSGDRTEHVLWRLQQAPLTALGPKAVVVMIGTNNIGAGAEPRDVVAGVRAVVSTILEQCAETKVLLVEILPRGEDFNEMRGRISQANQTLSRLDAFGEAASRVRWLPVGASFLELDGTISKQIMPDALHLSAEGYARWEQALRPALEQALQAP